MTKIYHKLLLLLPAIGIIGLFFSINNESEKGNGNTHSDDFLTDPQLKIYYSQDRLFNDDTKTIVHIVWKYEGKEDIVKFTMEKSEEGKPFAEVASQSAASKTDISRLQETEIASKRYNNILYSSENEGGYIFNELFTSSEFFSTATNVKYRIKAELGNGKVIYSDVVGNKKRHQHSGLRAPCPSSTDAIPKGYTKISGTTQTVACDCGDYTTNDYYPPCTTKISGCTDCAANCGCKYDPCCQHNCAQYADCNCPTWKNCEAGWGPETFITAISKCSTAPSVSGSTTNNTSCSTCNGAVDITPSGGCSASYTYSWSNGKSSQDITGLCAGSYTVTVSDASGCASTSKSYSISGTCTNPSGTTSVTNSTSCGASCNGAVDLTPKAGSCSGTFSYSWSNGKTTQDISSLCAGTYTVTITDGSGCTGSVSASVTGSCTAPSGTTSVTNCPSAGCTGSIDLSPKAGSCSGTFSYDWSNGKTTQDISSLCAGSYTVTITDGAGCTGTVSATVTCILPVELINFKAVKNDKIVVVSWTTASEINNDFFTVERSEDGTGFSDLKVVDGAGNSSQTKHYEYIDNDPVKGKSYYRLKLTDLNGSVTYSEIFQMKFIPKDYFTITPNPGKEKAMVEFYADNEEVDIIVTDISGKQVFKQSFTQVNGNIKYELNLSDFTTGTYYVSYKSSSGNFSVQKFLKY